MAYKVLHLGNSFDPAGDVTRSVSELKRYSKHEHEVHIMEQHPFHNRYQFQEPLLKGWNTDLLMGLFEWCDAVIYHFVGWESGLGLLKKPAAFRNSNIYLNTETGKHYASTWYNAKSLHEYKLLASSHLAAGDFLPDCRFLPALIPVNDFLYTADWTDREPCFLYNKDPEVAKHLQGEYTKVHHQGLPYVRALLERRRAATFVLDNITDGHYGLAGMEAMSQGIPVAVYNGDAAKAQLHEIAPFEAPPWLEVTNEPESTAAMIDTFLSYPDAFNQTLRMACRDWVTEFYHSQRLIGKFWDPFVEELCG